MAKKIKKIKEDGGPLNETPEQKYARYYAMYGSKANEIMSQEAQASIKGAIINIPKRKGYEPSQGVKNTKATLAATSLATGAGSNPISYLANVAGSIYDFGTATRYAMDGQWGNAAEDAAQGVIGLIPAAGRFNLSKTATNQRALTTTLQAANDVQQVIEPFNNGGMIKYAEGGPIRRGRQTTTSNTTTPQTQGQQAFAQYNYTDLDPSYTPQSSQYNVDANLVPTMAQNKDDQDVYAWTKAYINSPKYKERLNNFWKYPDYIQRQRASKAADVGFLERTGTGIGSAYTDTNAYPNQLQVNPNQAIQLHTSRGDITAHELGHLSNSNKANRALQVNNVEEKYILDRNRNVSPTEYTQFLDAAKTAGETNISNYLTNDKRINERNHDIAPSETMSDIQALRYNLNKAGIYDARTQDITPEQLQKARQNKTIMNQFTTQRLLKQFDDKGLLDILNKVAVNNNSIPSDMANNGIQIHSNGFNPVARTRSNPFDPSMDTANFGYGDNFWSVDVANNGIRMYDPNCTDALVANSGIHINPANKGKFNATKKRTGKTTEELTHSKDPLTRKRAIFAQNAAKWHHGNDGLDLPYRPNAVSTPENPLYYEDNPLDQARANISNYFQNAQPQVINDASLNFNPSFQKPYQDQTVNNTNDDTSDETDTQDTKPKGPSMGRQIAQSVLGGIGPINTGMGIAATAAVMNLATKGKRESEEYARLVRRYDTQDVYNPNAYGTGSQALMNDGGSIEGISENQFGSPIYQFNGPSHEDGGIPFQFQGQNVEVEGGETMFQDNQGNLNVFGNMIVPGTKKKFKTVSKSIADLEQKTQKHLDNSVDLVNQNDPTSTYGKYKFNAGKVMMEANKSKLEEIDEVKNELSDMQNMMLQAGYTEQSSKKLRKGGKISAAMFDDGGDLGDPSLAQRNNNPGNIMYRSDSQYQKNLGVTKGEPRYDDKGKIIGYFAKFPTLAAGQEGMKRQLFNSPNYRNLTVDQAARRWVHGSENSKEAGYQNIPSTLAGKKIKDLTPDEQLQTLHTFTTGEDSKKYNWAPLKNKPEPGPKTPYQKLNLTLPGLEDPNTITPPQLPTTPLIVPTVGQDTPTPKTTIDTQGNPVPPTQTSRRGNFPWSQIIPEIATIATERPEFVPGQTYVPEFYQPYQVTFQDRINNNNATFRALQETNSNNAALMSQLAGNLYGANAQVSADEFRTNQGIQNDITNKNISLMNDAKLKNMQLADEQMVRQETAKSNSRANVMNALNSISGKVAQANLEDRTLAVYENMFPHFTYDKNGKLQFQDVQRPTFYNGNGGGGNTLPSESQRSRTKYDANGKVKETVVTTPSKKDQDKLDLQIEKQRNQRRNIFKNIFG